MLALNKSCVSKLRENISDDCFIYLVVNLIYFVYAVTASVVLPM